MYDSWVQSAISWNICIKSGRLMRCCWEIVRRISCTLHMNEFISARLFSSSYSFLLSLSLTKMKRKCGMLPLAVYYCNANVSLSLIRHRRTLTHRHSFIYLYIVFIALERCHCSAPCILFHCYYFIRRLCAASRNKWRKKYRKMFMMLMMLMVIENFLRECVPALAQFYSFFLFGISNWNYYLESSIRMLRDVSYSFFWIFLSRHLVEMAIGWEQFNDRYTCKMYSLAPWKIKCNQVKKNWNSLVSSGPSEFRLLKRAPSSIHLWQNRHYEWTVRGQKLSHTELVFNRLPQR